MDGKSYPHQLLEGIPLEGGWRVVRKLDRPEGATGSNFSCGYIVEHPNGQRGYLKALDFFSQLSESKDPARALEPLIRAFNFERDLLTRARGLSRVVIALNDGAVTVAKIPPPATVQYIIFELAEGDVRTQMSVADQLDIAWALRSLHQVAVGLEQLHSIDVAHQDLKPSNVLLFDGSRSLKLADLGRAALKGIKGPHDDLAVPGDHGYAPPELLYGAETSSWEARRMACDAYLLGSMVAFLFTTLPMTSLVMMNLDSRLHWRNWRGSYAEVLPYLRASFSEAVGYVADEIPASCREDLREILIQLSDPEPALRGHPMDRQVKWGNPFSLKRYVSRFDLLAKKAEFGLIRGWAN